MILNGWWDRALRAAVSCTDDASSPAVSYGEQTKSTFSARLLKVPTFADQLRTQRPGSRVVSLSLKPRSAIGLAGHGGTVVTWTDDLSASFVTSRAFSPTPIEAVRDFLHHTPYLADAKKTWLLFAAETRGASTFFPVWQGSPFSDEYLARMASRMIDLYKLGQREEPDALAVSFSALDIIGHSYGPESREIEDALIRLDEIIGTLIEKLDGDVGREHYVMALTSDHGVAAIPQTVGAARIATDDIRERIEEVLVRQFGDPHSSTRYVANVTFTNVYFADGVWSRVAADEETWRRIEAAVVGMPGVGRLLRADRLDANSLDTEVRTAALSTVPDRSGDLMVVTKRNWTVGPRAEGSATTHGTAQPYDRQVPLILFGAGIKAGRLSTTASPADIAPTVAHITGVTMPPVEGRVLKEAF